MTRRRGPGDGSVQVELLEGGGPEEADGRSLPLPPQADDRARSRRLRLTGLLALLAVTIAILAAGVVDRRREAALRIALRDVPGILDPLDGPIAEVWRAPAEWPVIEDDRVMVLLSADGTRLTAVVVESGAVVWAGDVPQGASCLPFGGGAVQAPPVLWDRIACARTRGIERADGAGAGSLVVVDAAQGTVLLSRPLEESVLFITPVEDDLIIVADGRESRLEVRRWRPPDHDVWLFRSEPGLWDDLVSDADGWWGWWVEDDVFVIDGGSEMLALDIHTGEEVVVADVGIVSRSERGFPTSSWELSDGGTVVGTHPYTTPGSTRVLNADGSLRYQVSARPWMPGVADGSVPDIVTVRDEETREVMGLDATTGEMVWTADLLPGVEPTLQVDGVVVAQGAHAAVGVDKATGDTLWTADAAGSSSWPPLTDGEVVLVFTRNEGVGYLVAHDLRSGDVVWRVPIPEDTAYVRVLGRTTIAAFTGGEVVAYR